MGTGDRAQRVAIIVLSLVVVLPLLVVVGLLIFVLFKNYPGEEPHDWTFLLLVAPGCFVFLAGFVLGFVWLRNPARRLLAFRVRHAGMTLLFWCPTFGSPG